MGYGALERLYLHFSSIKEILVTGMGALPDKLRKQCGFTMIEVMIALLVLMIGIAGILTMQMASMRSASLSRHTTEAMIFAEDKMEELMIIPGAQLGIGPTTDTVTIPPPPNVPGLSGFVYTRDWTIDTDFVPGSSTTALVTVEVSWFERGDPNDRRDVTLSNVRRL